MRYLKYSIAKMIYLDCVHSFEILDERVCHTLYTDPIGQWFPNWGSRPTSGSPAILLGIA